MSLFRFDRERKLCLISSIGAHKNILEKARGENFVNRKISENLKGKINLIGP